MSIFSGDDGGGGTINRRVDTAAVLHVESGFMNDMRICALRHLAQNHQQVLLLDLHF